VATLLSPFHQWMRSVVLESGVIHTDDTRVTVLLGKQTRKGRAWAYIAPEQKIAVFDFTLTRGRDGPEKFLGDFCGYLQADAYAGYDRICAGKSVTEVACWAHARRKFHDAKRIQPQAALAALAWIRRLYEVERVADAYRDGLDVSLPETTRRQLYVKKRHEVRQAYAIGILDQIGTWLEKQSGTILPKSPVGEAISYVKSNWSALNTYVRDGKLSIDNNIAERAMRHAAAGRKNWQFVGSEKGGETWAVLTSVTYTAKLHGLNLYAYMQDVIGRIGETRLSELEQFFQTSGRSLMCRRAHRSEFPHL